MKACVKVSDDPKYFNLLVRRTEIKAILYLCSPSANLPRFGVSWGVSWHPAWGMLAPRSYISHLKHFMDDKYFSGVTKAYWLMLLFNLTYSCHKYNAFHLLKFLYTQNGTISTIHAFFPLLSWLVVGMCFHTHQTIHFSIIWLKFDFNMPFLCYYFFLVEAFF